MIESSVQKEGFLNDVIIRGIKEGFKSSLNVIKIMLPISLLIAILKYLGIVKLISSFASPILAVIGLRGESILALISGYLVNCYSAIAVWQLFIYLLKR